jgi:hypothetical protein
MHGLMFILFNPITLFGLLFFAFSVKNVITRHYPSAVIYFILSACIMVGGAWVWVKVATPHGPNPMIENPLKPSPKPRTERF